MSRKTRAFRVFLHQNQNPTVKQAWDAAWKRAQKIFHARSMQDMEEKLAAAQAECERLREALEAMLEIHGVTQRYADAHIEIPQSWVDVSDLARAALAQEQENKA